MAKYNWKQLEKEYILSEHISVSAFLKSKGISTTSGNTKKATKGWKEKKARKEEIKSTKIIEKTIEKEAEKESKQIADIRTIANDLALNIIKANLQLEKYIIKSKTKTKKIKYDYKVKKVQEEEVTENEEIETKDGIIDKKGLKILSSALKDINDIINNEPERLNIKKKELELKQKRLENDTW